MTSMGRLEYGSLRQAWTGEASDFTPLLAEQLDLIGEAIGVGLVSVGRTEVATTGGRRIDIVAEGADGATFVIENQYGAADHDHLARGLAYAVAARARGLVVIAEKHRDEFRQVAEYLNDMAAQDRDRGISVWLVEAQAVRIGDSAWAPLFATVAAPNEFTAAVEQERQQAGQAARSETFWAGVASAELTALIRDLIGWWQGSGRQISYRRGGSAVALYAPSPAKQKRSVVASISTAGSVSVPFSSYAGGNSGISIPELVSDEFRQYADELFGFTGDEQWAQTGSGWLTAATGPKLREFCERVAAAYSDASLPDESTP